MLHYAVVVILSLADLNVNHSSLPFEEDNYNIEKKMKLQ